MEIDNQTITKIFPKTATQDPSVPVFDSFFAFLIGSRGLFVHRVNPVAVLHPVLLHFRQNHSLCRDVPGLVLLAAKEQQKKENKQVKTTPTE